MKINLLLLFAVLIASSCANKTDTTVPNITPEKTVNVVNKKLRHVVLFKFKEVATSADITKVEAAFASLPLKIKEIKGFEWGLNNSPEALNKGFTHCFFVTFNTEEERSIYLPHPDHLAFVEILSPHLEDVLVLDYWTK